MPILDPDDSVAPAKDATIQIASPTYKGIAVDSTQVPVSRLLTSIEGMPWTVTYFSQVLGSDSSTVGQGVSTPASQQQYRQIKNLEIRVQSALQASQDPATKEISNTGSSLMFPFVVPNEGDMFLADVGDGREGLFQVTTVNRRSIYRQTCHDIEYKMVSFTREGDVRVRDLLEKTIKTFYFVREFITYGQNPLLFEAEHDHYRYFKFQNRQILSGYLKSFYSQEFDTIIVPGQSFITYDPYLMRAINSLFETIDGPQMYRARCLNVDDDEVCQATSIWDVIRQRDMVMMDAAFKKFGAVDANSFTWEPLFNGICFSGVQKVIYPQDAVLSVDYKRISRVKSATATVLSPGPNSMTMQAIEDDRPQLVDYLAKETPGFLKKEEEPPLIKPMAVKQAMADGYYVFSKAFYDQDTSPGKMSELELLVWDFLRGNALSLVRLRALTEQARQWTSLNQFYFIPVLLVLIRSALRGL